jgi:ubiquinone/menaquinone biosynthesis C-methylase UbiE
MVSSFIFTCFRQASGIITNKCSTMKLTHESKVEKFYSHGSETRGLQEGGYLSFGYWTSGIKHYHQAVETLIDRILKSEHSLNQGKVLNVARGYGAETIRIYEKIKPESIIAIDITGAHIDFARQKAESENLSAHIQFEKMDACKLSFENASFDYVIGIEGPAHFNTREMFLQKAYQILKPKGILLLSDIIVNKKVTEQNYLNKLIGRFCAKHWFMPRENWMSIPKFKAQIEKLGFKIDSLESAGKNVYPGFSKYNLKWKSIINAVHTRGIRIGLALTFISWLLGYVYRRGMIDYVLLRAIK